MFSTFVAPQGDGSWAPWKVLDCMLGAKRTHQNLYFCSWFIASQCLSIILNVHKVLYNVLKHSYVYICYLYTYEKYMLSFLGRRSHGGKLRHRWSRFILLYLIFFGLLSVESQDLSHDEKFKFLEFSTLQQFECLIISGAGLDAWYNLSLFLDLLKYKTPLQFAFRRWLWIPLQRRPPHHGILYFCLTVFWRQKKKVSWTFENQLKGRKEMILF